MRYFIEVAYDGLNHSGFQIQKNAITIQSLLEDALHMVLKTPISLTGSSRTDAQVNAYQNFFHFDLYNEIDKKIVYNLNAILPPSIVVKDICKVIDDAHARFSATARTYEYIITTEKNPFLYKKSYPYPFPISIDKLEEAAAIILSQTNYANFCKTNVQVNNFICQIYDSRWSCNGSLFTYTVTANRFLRGMVKALVGTMLSYATKKISKTEFLELFSDEKTNVKANFSPPGYALYLQKVNFPENIFRL